MALKRLANEMKETAQGNVLRGRVGRAPECCMRQTEADGHKLSVVLTLHEKNQRGDRIRYWQLTVAEDDQKVIPNCVVHRVLSAFFGHGDFADELPEEQYPERLKFDHIRTFVAKAA